MSVSSQDVAEVSRLLYSDKITDRKKASERFRTLLDDKKVIAVIDCCTDEKSNFTWSSALQAVINHIQKELEQKAKDKTKNTGIPSARARNMTVCSSLLKLVIKKASLKKARLQQPPIDHILSILQDADASLSLGNDYCSILLKEVLEKRHVWSTVPLNVWQDLLDTVCELACAPVQIVEKNTLMKTLERILAIGSVQTQLNCDKLFPFFTEIAKGLRQENVSNQEDALSALISFSRAVSLECRIKLSQHGEEILNFILNLWEFRAQGKKELIIEYLRMQMVVHHPNGALTPEDGACIYDANSWKITLQKMYNCLQQELKEMICKRKQNQNIILSSSFLKLHAELCRQVNSFAYEDLNTSMIAEIGSHHKKRKTQTAFSTLLDTIYEQAEILQVVHWLQLLTAWLNEFPDSLKEPELKEVVLQLHQIMINCKNSEIMNALLITCLACVGCYVYANNNPKSTNLIPLKSSHWALIYNKVLLTFNLSITRESSVKLLTALVKSHLVNPGIELWQLFGVGSKTCTDSLMELLSACMGKSPLPERCLSNGPSVIQEFSGVRREMCNDFRCQLVDWLLPCLMNEEHQLYVPINVSVSHLADILCSLVLRNVPQKLLKKRNCAPATREAVKTDSHSLCAEFYLSSSFVVPLTNSTSFVRNNFSTEDMQDNRKLPDVMKKLVEFLIRDVCHLLELGNAEDHVKLLARYCCLLVKFVQQLLAFNVLIVADVNNHPLTQHIRALLKKVVSFLEKSRKGPTHCSTYLEVVDILLPIVVNDGAIQAAFTRSVTPQKLVDLFTEVVHHAVNSSINRLTDPVELDDDLFSSSAEFGLGDDDFEVSSTHPAHFAQRIRTSEDLVNPTSLNDEECLALKIGEFLTLWCQWDNYPVRELESETDPKVLKKHLLDSIKDSKFEFQAPLNLQLALKLMTNLMSREQQHDEETFYTSIVIMKTLFSAFHKDVFITSLCLCLLKTMIYHAGKSTSKNQEITIHQLKAFWKLHKKKKLGIKLLISFIECVAAIAEVDKANSWGRWEFLLDETSLDSGSDAPIVLSLIHFLNHSSYQVQTAAASYLPLLIDYSENEQLLPYGIVQWKDKVMQLVFKACHKAEPETMCANSDSAVNYTTFLLKVVFGLASACCYCENAAICFLFEISTKKNVDLNIVTKVWSQILMNMDYSSQEEFAAARLKFILNFWFEKKWTLSSFPFQLLKCSTEEEFCGKYTFVIVVMVLLHAGKTGLDKVAGLLKEDSVCLITRSVPQIAAELMPLVVANRLNPDISTVKVDRHNYKKAESAFTTLESSLSKEVFQKLMATNFTFIVAQFMLLIEDSEDGENGNRRIMPPELPHTHPKTVILTSCQELVQCTNASNNISIIAALANVQDGLQTVLLELKVKLLKAQGFYKKWRSLLIYASFVKELLKEMDTDLAGNRFFIIQDVIHTLVHFLNENGHGATLRCARQACDLLQEMCAVSVKNCPDELGNHLQVIVGTLVSLQPPELKDKAAKLLRTLLVSNVDALSAYIQCLDPLPDVPELAEVVKVYHKVKYDAGNLTLKKEIDYFLNATNITLSFPRIEGLRYLKKQLATRKEELKQMLESLEGSEDGGNSLLHHLIVELIRSSSSSCHEESLEAGRCLGEIGPVNLCNLVLEVGNTTKHRQILDSFDGDGIAQRNVIIFKLLLEYLFSNNVVLVTTTSHVLKEIFSTRSGQQFISLCKSKHVDNVVQLLHPFILKKNQRKQSVLSPSEDVAVLCDANLWVPDAKDHQLWITDLVGALLTQASDEVLVHLADVAKLKHELCEQIFPFIIHSLLTSGGQDMHGVLSQYISMFFEKHCTSRDASVSSRSSSQTSGIEADSSVHNNHQSIKCMLSVIQYLRTRNRDIVGCQILPWENNFWLALNYFHIARAAIYCKAYFTSLMALEIWFDDVERMGPSHRQSLESVLYNSDDIYTSTYHTMPALQEKTESETIYGLILESYRSIGEQDGWYGCGAAPLINASIRVMQYEQENQWQKALSLYDNEALHTPSFMGQGLPSTLKMLGLSHLLQRYLHQSADTVKQGNLEEFQELQYECAWRLGQWSSMKQGGSSGRFHETVYSCLSSVREEDYSSFLKCLKDGHDAVILELSGESLESTYSVYPFLTKMQMLTVIEDYKDSIVNKNTSMDMLITKWKSQDLVPQINFLFSEPVISLQCTLLQQSSTSLVHMRSLVERLDWKIEFARKAGYLQIAASTVNSIKELKHVAAPQSWSCQLQEARTFWQQKEPQLAMYLMVKLLRELKMVYQESPTTAAAVYSSALGVYSNWLIEDRSENPNIVLSNLTTAIKVCSDSDNSTGLMDAHLAAGRFADAHYQRIQNFKKSEMFEAKQELMQKSRREARMLIMQGLQTADQKRAFNLFDKQSKIDEKELLAMDQDQQTFLQQAIVNYLGCLKAGDACNLRVFRLTSLWFQNKFNVNVNTLLQSVLNIKTHKFLPIMYQSAARMSTDGTPFQNTLTKLIEQVSSDHPYHTLHIILALCNATADDRLVRQTSSRRTKIPEIPEVQDEERIAAAKNVWHILLGKPHLKQLMEKMEKLCAAYISLSNITDQKDTPPNVPIPMGNKAPLMKKLPDLSIVPDLTLNIPIDPSANYSDVPGIAQIEHHYQLCGGVNAPKRLVCIGTDGVRRTQLLKGKDDLRQDAVMQQVFGIVNSLLKQNPETKKRNLNIRTYKVVPLSQRSGILQWCTGTLPIGDYLLGAHGRYYPKDWNGSKCRKKLMDIAGGTPENKLEVFHEISRNLHPVFRHFFMEKFIEPTVWFESRLKYTKSVATTSMVGFILGLGDRHVQNILVDQKTAELIHIDLGVAFEQGRTLPTPETVPFRLTRDIVDGMGITGVEGVYRRCCEKTLDVLRQSQEVVTTILDVLLYDPLYVWSISPMKACTLQPEPIETQLPSTNRSTSDIGSSRPPSVGPVETQSGAKDGEPNKHAERCLLRVQHKLQGMEEGVTMSVTGQVNHLIQEATDPKNLCRLFSGWQPYL